MHDLLLKDNELAAYSKLSQIDPEKFTQDQINEFKRHPIVNAEFAASLTEVPPDVDTIIRQHHELPDGTGFPRQLNSSQIASLSAIFIVAHDIVTFFIAEQKKNNTLQLEEYIQIREEYFSRHHFKKVMNAVKSL
jgi:HD-GYP domain-containing protein (c-di-GMP phosphodiesterase class II)